MKVDLGVIWRATKEPLREIVLAVIPVLLVYLQKLNVPWAAVLYIALRSLDSYMHEKGKVEKDDKLVTGLTRF